MRGSPRSAEELEVFRLQDLEAIGEDLGNSGRSLVMPRLDSGAALSERNLGRLLWMEENLHHLKKPKNDSLPVNTNKQWFAMVS